MRFKGCVFFLQNTFVCCACWLPCVDLDQIQFLCCSIENYINTKESFPSKFTKFVSNICGNRMVLGFQLVIEQSMRERPVIANGGKWIICKWCCASNLVADISKQNFVSANNVVAREHGAIDKLRDAYRSIGEFILNISKFKFRSDKHGTQACVRAIELQDKRLVVKDNVTCNLHFVWRKVFSELVKPFHLAYFFFDRL